MILLFILLILPVISAVSFDSSTILNTSSSNSSITFSLRATAERVVITSDTITLTTVYFVQGGVNKTCSSIVHTLVNNNMDSSQFPCSSWITTTCDDITAKANDGMENMAIFLSVIAIVLVGGVAMLVWRTGRFEPKLLLFVGLFILTAIILSVGSLIIERLCV